MVAKKSGLEQKVKRFMVKLLELAHEANGLQSLTRRTPPQRERLKALEKERSELFKSADKELKRWIRQQHLKATSPWLTYQTLSLSLEDQHLQQQYQQQSDGNDFSLIPDPLLQDLETLLQPEPYTPAVEVTDIIEPMPLDTLSETVTLAMGLQDGSVWEVALEG